MGVILTLTLTPPGTSTREEIRTPKNVQIPNARQTQGELMRSSTAKGLLIIDKESASRLIASSYAVHPHKNFPPPRPIRPAGTET